MRAHCSVAFGQVPPSPDVFRHFFAAANRICEGLSGVGQYCDEQDDPARKCRRRLRHSVFVQQRQRTHFAGHVRRYR